MSQQNPTYSGIPHKFPSGIGWNLDGRSHIHCTFSFTLLPPPTHQAAKLIDSPSEPWPVVLKYGRHQNHRGLLKCRVSGLPAEFLTQQV